MIRTLSFAVPSILVLCAHFTLAQTVVVNETFDSYADESAFEAVWQPDAGPGNQPAGQAGFLIPTPSPTVALPEPYNNPPDLQGKAVVGNYNGGINEYNGSSYSLAPTATEAVVLRGDIFVTGDNSTSRQTIGIRNDTIDRDPNLFGDQVGLNLLEMGTWNAATCDATVEGCNPGGSTIQDPNDPWYTPTTNFGYRLVLWQFGSYGTLTENGVEIGELLSSPNYQYFPLDPLLDVTGGPDGTPDGLVDVGDIGDGWHTYEAVITETDITLTLDLYRDGINNATGAPGVDSTVNIEVMLAVDPANPSNAAAFDSLRIGGPSGVASTNSAGDPRPAAFDNIYFALEAPMEGTPGDFNGDGLVNLADYTVWRDNLGAADESVLANNGDGTNGVNAGDYEVWKQAFGNASSASIVASANVPEPSTASIAGLIVLGSIALARRRLSIAGGRQERNKAKRFGRSRR